ncbi:MAG: ABC transporter substrate-binding protein [Desulfobacterales bacterium]|nr:ABC transporter substrate-binding protein [Desulfobacterales bacterium]
MKRLVNRRNLVKAALLIVVISMSGLALNDVNAGTRGVSDDEVRVGIVPDLSGPAADGVRKFMWSLQKYFEAVNRAGGIHGRKIKLYSQDGKYNPSIALNAFKKLVLKKKVFAMVANLGSGMVKAQLPFIEKYNVPLVCPGVQSSWISNPPKRLIFSTMLSMGYCSRVLIDYVVNDLGDKKPRIGVCYMNTEMGHEALKEIKDHAGKYGFGIITEAGFMPGSIDMSGQIAKLKAAKVDYVMVCAICKGSAYACKEAAKLDWKPQFLFPGNGSTEKIFALGKQAMFYGKPPLGASEYLPVSEDSEAKRLCLKWMREDGLDEKELVIKTLYGVTYGKTFVEGLKRAGRDLSVESFIKGMEGIKDFDNGAQAPVTFGPDIRQGVTKVVVYRGIPGGADGIGRWSIVKPWTEPKN